MKHALIMLLLATSLFGQRINLQPVRTTFPTDSLNIYTIVGDGGEVYLEQVPFASLKSFLADSGLVAKTKTDTMNETGTGHKYYINHNQLVNPTDDQSSNQWGHYYNYAYTPETLSFLPATWNGYFQWFRNSVQDTIWPVVQGINFSLSNWGNLGYTKNYTASISNPDSITSFAYNWWSFINNHSNSLGAPYINTAASFRPKMQNWNLQYSDTARINNAYIVNAQIINDAESGKPAKIGNIDGFSLDVDNNGSDAVLGDVTGYRVQTISNEGTLSGDFKGVHIEPQPLFGGTNYGVHDESDSSKFNLVITDAVKIPDSNIAAPYSGAQTHKEFYDATGGSYPYVRKDYSYTEYSPPSGGTTIYNHATDHVVLNEGSDAYWILQRLYDLDIKAGASLREAHNIYTSFANEGDIATNFGGFSLYASSKNSATVNGHSWGAYASMSNYISFDHTGTAPYMKRYSGYYTKFQNSNPQITVDAPQTDLVEGFVSLVDNYSNNSSRLAYIDSTVFFRGKAQNRYGGTLTDLTGLLIENTSNVSGGTLAGDFKGVHIESQPDFDGTMYGVFDETDSSKFNLVITDKLKINDFTIEDMDVTPDGRFYMITETGGTYYTPRYAASDTTGKW